MSCLPKPVLRGHVARRGIIWVASGFGVAIASVLSLHYLVFLPKRRKYQEFFKTYDGDAHYAEIQKYGLSRIGKFEPVDV